MGTRAAGACERDFNGVLANEIENCDTDGKVNHQYCWSE